MVKDRDERVKGSQLIVNFFSRLSFVALNLPLRGLALQFIQDLDPSLDLGTLLIRHPLWFSIPMTSLDRAGLLEIMAT